MTELITQSCVPCEGGVEKLSEGQARGLLEKLEGWRLSDDSDKLLKQFSFKDFVANMAFLNKVADTAENEGHHPDFSVHYNRSNFEIWTHAIGGLSENDFILAAKIDQVAQA